jgi:hypothetical protein
LIDGKKTAHLKMPTDLDPRGGNVLHNDLSEKDYWAPEMRVWTPSNRPPEKATEEQILSGLEVS